MNFCSYVCSYAGYNFTSENYSLTRVTRHSLKPLTPYIITLHRRRKPRQSKSPNQLHTHIVSRPRAHSTSMTRHDKQQLFPGNSLPRFKIFHLSRAPTRYLPTGERQQQLGYRCRSISARCEMAARVESLALCLAALR